MYRYETHCHTSPVSNCAKASVEDTVCFYQQIGYDGLFITNHFLDGNIDPWARTLSWRGQIDYYFADYERGALLGQRIGIKVFPGVELSYRGTDFLIYGLDKEWYKTHPEIMTMDKTDELGLMMREGAFIIQAHPYREAHYIDHIRLYPRSVHGVEVINSGQAWESNMPASVYAEHYGLLKTAGSDNHWGSGIFEKFAERGYRTEIAGMCSETPVDSVEDYISFVRKGMMRPFLQDAQGNSELL